MNFGNALILLKAGRKVARAGWNGKGMWLYLTQGITLAPGTAYRGAALVAAADNVGQPVVINDHIDMKTADGSIAIGWLASQADMLSEDWEIVE